MRDELCISRDTINFRTLLINIFCIIIIFLKEKVIQRSEAKLAVLLKEKMACIS